MRIRDNWKSSEPHSVEETASAIAYIIWQIGLTYTKNLHQEEFDFESDKQRVEVIQEYLIFLSHITDRISYDQISTQSRQPFMQELANQVARHYQRNVEEILGPGDYKNDFLALANSRFEGYARGRFDNDEPGYSIRRYLGNVIQEIMGQSQINKWVIQQIIDIDSLEAAEKLKKSVNKLLANCQPA